MAREVKFLHDVDAPYEVRFTNFAPGVDIQALRRWLRYQGKGEYRLDLMLVMPDYRPGCSVRFTDADTAFWAKMSFA